tara:strand:+ start:2476 stop:2583 length:108 start_codon:yes stop_codon:yes gene_type:complete
MRKGLLKSILQKKNDYQLLIRPILKTLKIKVAADG